jgi:serine phosphatase RsbU (regulator of sigma subunit)
MSMIAYSLLYRAIKVKKTYNPARILELLHVETRVVLRQKDGINTDGMDLCLCVLEENKYNPGEYSLIYAGAKRPLYLVKENQFIILEECRKSVGGFQSKNIQFENRQITIKKGDTLYLTTDGLADQNNVQRKKITEKKVQEFIKDNIHKSLNEQYQELEKILNQHQEGT